MHIPRLLLVELTYQQFSKVNFAFIVKEHYSKDGDSKKTNTTWLSWKTVHNENIQVPVGGFPNAPLQFNGLSGNLWKGGGLVA